MTARVPGAKAVRRAVSRRETIVSWSLVALMPVIAGVVYVGGQRYDPALLALDGRSLAPRTTAPRPVALLTTTGTADAPAAGSLPAPALPAPPEGWTADGSVEHFTAESLYQKIDGRADVYLRDGFAGLDATSYARGSHFIDVFVYDMGSDAHAQARFSAERPATAAPADLGRAAYRSEASCFFVNGRHYVQVIASDRDPDTDRAALQTARAVVEALGSRMR